MTDEQQPWDGQERRAPIGWAFKREVSVGNLLSIVALAAPLLVWAINIDKRLSLIETITVAQQRVDERQEMIMSEIKREIRSELALLNAKVDRIVERVGGNGSGGR